VTLVPPAEIAADRTGRGILVAVVDSGISFGHPHLRIVGRGFSVEREEGDIVIKPGAHADRFGHGTCCAALVHLLAPDAELLAIRVTSDRPTTDGERLARGLELAIDEGARIILAPNGTKTVLPDLGWAIARAAKSGAIVVAPLPEPGVLPGAHPAALGVLLLDGVDVAHVPAGVGADGHARPTEGLVRNFYGPSLSAARVAAALARHAESIGGQIDVEGFKSILPVR